MASFSGSDVSRSSDAFSKSLPSSSSSERVRSMTATTGAGATSARFICWAQRKKRARWASLVAAQSTAQRSSVPSASASRASLVALLSVSKFSIALSFFFPIPSFLCPNVFSGEKETEKEAKRAEGGGFRKNTTEENTEQNVRA